MTDSHKCQIKTWEILINVSHAVSRVTKAIQVEMKNLMMTYNQ